MAKNLINDVTFEFDEGTEKADHDNLAATVTAQGESIDALQNALTGQGTRITAVEGDIENLEAATMGFEVVPIVFDEYVYEERTDIDVVLPFPIEKSVYSHIIIEHIINTLQITENVPTSTSALKTYLVGSDNSAVKVVEHEATFTNSGTTHWFVDDTKSIINLETGTMVMAGIKYVGGEKVDANTIYEPATWDCPDLIEKIRLRIDASTTKPMNGGGIVIRVTGVKKI